MDCPGLSQTSWHTWLWTSSALAPSLEGHVWGHPRTDCDNPGHAFRVNSSILGCFGRASVSCNTRLTELLLSMHLCQRICKCVYMHTHYPCMRDRQTVARQLYKYSTLVVYLTWIMRTQDEYCLSRTSNNVSYIRYLDFLTCNGLYVWRKVHLMLEWAWCCLCCARVCGCVFE